MANPMNEALGMLLSGTKNGAKNGVNGNGLRKIRDIPNYKDSQEFKVLNDRMNQHQWSVDENKYLNLDTDDQIKLHQEITYHSGTVTTKGNLWYNDQPWMKDSRSLGKVNKKGKPSHVKAKQSFKRIQDPSEIGYNDDKRYAGTQAKQAEDRAYSLEEGTTGYNEVKARLAELDPDGTKGINTPDMLVELRNTNKRQVKDKLDTIKQWNKDLKEYEGVTDKEQYFSAGHASSRAKGGPAVASNYGFPETKAANFSSQNKNDLPKWVLEEIGVDTSWSMWVDTYLSDAYGLGLREKTDAQRFLTDLDRLDILNRKVDWKTALQARIDDLNNAY
tara:strand:+ start:759 stop:1754 length:996 start_codon:yes stop_codon:yes gene_type:complete